MSRYAKPERNTRFATFCGVQAAECGEPDVGARDAGHGAGGGAGDGDVEAGSGDRRGSSEYSMLKCQKL